MIGTVWYDDLDNGQRKMDEIKKEYFQKNVRMICEKYNNHYQVIMMEFENGDTWYLKSAYSYALGKRSNISYIESTIPKDVVTHIIRPCAYSTPFIKYKEYIF
jgi:hypothetical protein